MFSSSCVIAMPAQAVGGKLHKNSYVVLSRILLRPSHMQLWYYFYNFASSSIFYLHKSQTPCKVARILSYIRDFDQVTLFLSSLCLVKECIDCTALVFLHKEHQNKALVNSQGLPCKAQVAWEVPDNIILISINWVILLSVPVSWFLQ